MAIAIDTQPARWKANQVYALSAFCLVLGLLLGYLFRDSGSPQPAASAPKEVASAAAPKPANVVDASRAMPTLEQMNKMADKQAEPLLQKLKSDPNNASLLNQIGNVYRAAHQFKQAASYYQKSLQIAPDNVAARTDMASCMYYEGDLDGALSQLQQSLHYRPGDANSLFNLGMIRWQGKKDAAGAVAAWQQLLQANPKLDKDRRSEVEKLISQIQLQAKAN